MRRAKRGGRRTRSIPDTISDLMRSYARVEEEAASVIDNLIDAAEHLGEANHALRAALVRSRHEVMKARRRLGEKSDHA